MAKKKTQPTVTAASVSSYKHEDKRKRIPTQEESQMISPRDRRPVKKTYQYDPSLDPQLTWSGKAELGTEFGVSTVPIYVQEKISPEAIIAKLKDEGQNEVQFTLFGDTAAEQYKKMADFYTHEDNWQNRMILGDSLVVMNSLLEKEGMRGRVQCVYIDPPYGIKFGSNWQVSTKKRDVKDNKTEDFVRQPEQVKAFRDTWELGIHSYLTYLRDRLVVARDLLTESGSCFVQISEENVHLVRNLMDEVFGSENFVSQISYLTTSGRGSKLIDNIYDHIIWYAKDRSGIKYRQLFLERDHAVLGTGQYDYLLTKNGEVVPNDGTTKEAEAIPCAHADTTSQGETDTGRFPIEFKGKEYLPPAGRHWRTTPDGMKKLIDLGRIVVMGNRLRYIQFASDYPVVALPNLWLDTVLSGFSTERVYVVQTLSNVIQRCVLMTTDPGDLVLDPTCGSGTTAHVAEQWGRRWITTDTSRVALALARTRLMSAKFSYYKRKDDNDVRAGFEYRAVTHVTLKSLANNETAEKETLYDQPIEDNKRVRVAGPFTVESLSPHRVSDDQQMLATEDYVANIVDNLRASGVQTGDKGARVKFENLDILPGGPELHARGEYKTEDGLKTATVAIGPEFGSVDDDFVRAAVAKAKQFADLLVVAATSFEASALAEPAEVDGLRVMKVKINPDLTMGDLLKKTGCGNLFMAFGEPDIKVEEKKGQIVVEIKGVDVYDPVKCEIRSSGSGKVDDDLAAWFIDTNYDERSFFVAHAYFLDEKCPFDKFKKLLKAEISEEAWDSMCSTVSRPFPKPSTGKIAVKAINHYGDEVMKVIEIK